MKSVDFDERNVLIAEHQEEYETLPAHFNPTQGTVTTCFKLTEEEKKQVEAEGVIYLTIQTGGKPLQPIGNSLLNPFREMYRK